MLPTSVTRMGHLATFDSPNRNMTWEHYPNWWLFGNRKIHIQLNNYSGDDTLNLVKILIPTMFSNQGPGSWHPRFQTRWTPGQCCKTADILWFVTFLITILRLFTLNWKFATYYSVYVSVLVFLSSAVEMCFCAMMWISWFLVFCWNVLFIQQNIHL